MVVLIFGLFLSFLDEPAVNSQSLFLYFLDVKWRLAMLVELGLAAYKGVSFVKPLPCCVLEITHYFLAMCFL